MRHASDIVTIIGADGEARYESPSVERILGFEPGELVGKSVMDRLHPDDIEDGLEALGKVASEPGVSDPSSSGGGIRTARGVGSSRSGAIFSTTRRFAASSLSRATSPPGRRPRRVFATPRRGTVPSSSKYPPSRT
jgi:PAS domain-containing protein